MQTHFHYLYCPEFSCIIKLSSSGTELQRISIPRSDLMKLALVCWENSIDKLDTEREQQKYNTARKRLHRVRKLCYNSRRRLSLAVFQVMQQQLSGKSKELIILWSSVRFRPVAPSLCEYDGIQVYGRLSKFGKGNGFKIHRCSHLAGSIPASATYIERK